MTTPELPSLGPNIEYLGQPSGPDEQTVTDGGLKLPILLARYRVHDLKVEIGWVVGHPMGSFREPNKVSIDFDSYEIATAPGSGSAPLQTQALDGITTSLLRSIPMAHARALMRDRHEQLSVADVRSGITPLPSRVESDRDYVHVAAAYVALGGVSVEPIKRLSEWTGESVDTWSARLRRARAKGILQGTGRQAQIASAYLNQSHEIWATMRARKDEPDGH